MVVIRLARHGRHKYPTYRIVAADKRRAATSKFLAILGTYNPHTKEITLKKDEIAVYLKNGAQASDRVLRILKSEGVELPAWAKTHDRNKAPKKEVETQDVKTEDKPDSDTNEVAANEEPKTAEVASEQTESTDAKAEEIKNDVGTIAEVEDKNKEAEVTEEVAKAVEKTVDQSATKEEI